MTRRIVALALLISIFTMTGQLFAQQNVFHLFAPPELRAQAQSQPQVKVKRPNVVIVMADDQGWGDLSIHGNTNLKTPRVDSIGTDGAIFDRFYACPVCSPTRAELLTGRYHPRSGVHGTSTGAERMNVDEVTLGDTFKAAGYATGAFGKWHNGTQWPYHPNARGFDEYYGFCSGHWGQYFDPVLEHNGQLTRGKGFITDDLTTHALDFIAENKDQPFLCYLPYNVPHTPFQVPDEFFNRFADREFEMLNRDEKSEEVERTRAALAMCENIDWNVGRVLDQLDKLGLADNTIVIYLSDNGPNSWRWNDGMRGKKGSTDEGGVRVPCLVRWTGKIQPGTKIDRIAGMIDLLPTLAGMCGVEMISTKPIDGRSLVGLLMGETGVYRRDRIIFSHQSGRVSARSQLYRFSDRGQLYDMTADPGQAIDIAKQRPDVAARFQKAVDDFKAVAMLNIKTDDRPFPTGYAERRTTVFPARDGVAGGCVKRSARAPNCSYFTNWVDTSGVITWDVETMQAGTYEATVYYTCPKADVGSTIELTFGGAKVVGKVTEPNDPPAIGESFDRVNRGSESYVKDFKPLLLGTFELPKGRNVLTLRATNIPGDQALEVRAVTLTLK